MTGPVALVGSGEYLPELEAVDRALLAAAPRQGGSVVLVPTAAGLEPGMPAEWNRLGVGHFTRIGVPVEGLLLLTREEADDRFVEIVRGARMIYFSGGNPNHLIEAVRGTPFWDAVLEAYRGGAALAGCSAGAMMLAARVQRLRSAGEWQEGMGIVPQAIVAPHFDRIETFRPGILAEFRSARPQGYALLGVDELTALAFMGDGWQVYGAGGVLVVDDGGDRRYRAGERVSLPPPAA